MFTSVEKLPNLKSIDLSDNPMAKDAMKKYTSILPDCDVSFEGVYDSSDGYYSSLELAMNVKNKSNVVVLELTNQSLSSIPEDITDFKNPQSLVLSNNQLSIIKSTQNPWPIEKFRSTDPIRKSIYRNSGVHW